MRARKGGRIEAAAHVLALEEGWADADNRPMPVFEDIGVVAGDTVYRDQERFGKWVRRLNDPYPYEGGEMIELNKKLLARWIDQSVAIQQLTPKAVLGNKTIEGGRGGGQKTSMRHKERRTQWERKLRDYYKDHPLTRRIWYRTEADRLLRDRLVKWADPRPKTGLLRKVILPPLLRELFPHLCS